jgi:hypothetical protein
MSVAWRRSHPKNVSASNKRAYDKRRRTRPLAHMLKNSRSSAKRRHLPFMISERDLLIGGKLPSRCPVLGCKLKYSGSGYDAARATLDRIDNCEGYVSGNVAIISWRANKLKADASATELRALANYASRR